MFQCAAVVCASRQVENDNANVVSGSMHPLELLVYDGVRRYSRGHVQYTAFEVERDESVG